MHVFGSHEPFALFRIPGNKDNLIHYAFKESIRRSINVLPWYVKKYFSWPLARRASPPTSTTADLTGIFHIKMTSGQINRGQEDPD